MQPTNASTIFFVQVQQKLGYCPQFDALIEQMTVRETLAMFARLRGIDEKQIPRVVVMLVTNLLLQDHIDKQCGDLRWVNVRVYTSVRENPILLRNVAQNRHREM